MEIQLPNKSYNIDSLTHELRTALGESIFGVSGRKGRYYAILSDGASANAQNTVITIAQAHNAAQLSPMQQTFANIKSTAQGAAGIALPDLTAAQVRALLAVLLYRNGGVTDDGKVKPLAEWAG